METHRLVLCKTLRGEKSSWWIRSLAKDEHSLGTFMFLFNALWSLVASLWLVNASPSPVRYLWRQCICHPSVHCWVYESTVMLLCFEFSCWIVPAHLFWKGIWVHCSFSLTVRFCWNPIHLVESYGLVFIERGPLKTRQNRITLPPLHGSSDALCIGGAIHDCLSINMEPLVAVAFINSDDWCSNAALSSLLIIVE